MNPPQVRSITRRQPHATHRRRARGHQPSAGALPAELAPTARGTQLRKDGRKCVAFVITVRFVQKVVASLSYFKVTLS